MAFALGGDTVTTRLATLVEMDPGSVYRKNRGHFVANAFSEVLPEYPLGAGLGRWGMMNQYFGNPEDVIWNEVQWGGWILDAGIFMADRVSGGVIAILVTVARRGVSQNLGGGEAGFGPRSSSRTASGRSR